MESCFEVVLNKNESWSKFRIINDISICTMIRLTDKAVKIEEEIKIPVESLADHCPQN